MIDYDKLKIVAELAASLPNYKVEVHLEFGALSLANKEATYYLIEVIKNVGEDGEFFNFTDIDSLIDKIKEITPSSQKYHIGQAVWRLNERSEPEEFIIKGYRDGLYLDGREHPLFLSGWEEHHLYPSLKGLVETQIAYWNKFLPDNDEIHVGLTIASNGQIRSLHR